MKPKRTASNHSRSSSDAEVGATRLALVLEELDYDFASEFKNVLAPLARSNLSDGDLASVIHLLKDSQAGTLWARNEGRDVEELRKECSDLIRMIASDWVLWKHGQGLIDPDRRPPVGMFRRLEVRLIEVRKALPNFPDLNFI